METVNYFHDASLVGIQIEGSSIHLAIVMQAKNYTVILKEVAYFDATDFFKGNIILDATIKQEYSENDLKELLMLRYEEGYINDVSLKKAVDNKLCYFELNPSYGCSIRCLCAHVVVQS